MALNFSGKFVALMIHLLVFTHVPVRKNSYLTQAFPFDICRLANIDLLLVADSRISWADQQRFFPNILNYFLEPGEDDLTRVRVGLVVASPDVGPSLQFSFDTYNNRHDVVKELSEMSADDADNATVAGFNVFSTMNFSCNIFRPRETKEYFLGLIIMVVGPSWPETVDEILELHKTQQEGEDCKSLYIFLVMVEFDLDDSMKLRIAETSNQFYSNRLMFSPMLPVKLCNECHLSSWTMRHDTNYMLNIKSCYFLFINTETDVSWLGASNGCKMQGAQLVSIETQEELLFLNSTLNDYADVTFSVSPPDFDREFLRIYIGLTRDTNKIGAPFQWVNGYPVIYTHWVNKLPIRGPAQRCGMWIFRREEKLTDSSITDDSFTSGNYDGWLDVGCGDALSYAAVCEVVIEGRSSRHGSPLMASPANVDSFAQALPRGEFIVNDYGDIISIPAHVKTGAYAELWEEKVPNFIVFHCMGWDDDTTKIPYSYVCDHIRHCENGRDETICQYRKCDPNKEFTCRSLQCVPLESRCDVYRDCYDGSDEENCDFCNAAVCCDGSCLPRHLVLNEEIDCNICENGMPGKNQTFTHDEIYLPNTNTDKSYDCPFICNRSNCVFTHMLNDSIVDCLGPEGPLDETIGKLETSISCDVTRGGSTYPRWSPRCVYVKDRFGTVLGCKNMSHLHDCQDFMCPEGYTKCIESYCIPYHHVGDGIKDCPMGEDEWGLDFYCMGNFDCSGSVSCVHPDLVCDGHPHCPSGDDELNCYVSCANGFQCIAGTVTVTDFNKSKPLDTLSFIDTRTRYVDLSGIDLSKPFKHENRGRFINLIELYLSDCNLNDVEGNFVVDVRHLDTVYTLDLSHNRISSITANNMFRYMTNLRILDLSHNKLLTSLPDSEFSPSYFQSPVENLNLAFTGLNALSRISFYGLPKLKHLNVSNTLLGVIDKKTFPETFQLTSLDLRKTQLSDIQPNALTGLSVSQHLYSDLFKLCCPQVRGDGIADDVCHTPPSSISSCTDLVREPVQRVLLWTVGVLAIVGNVVVIVYRFVYERNFHKKSYGFFVTNLSVSDLLMGVYLFIIASKDVIYRGEYVWHESQWRHSALCQAASFLSTISSETSAFFILLVTIDRFLVMKFPFGQFHFSKTTMLLSGVVAWSIGFALALIPILPTFANWELHSSNGMCLGLLLSPERHTGWEYSMSVFIILNFLLFIFIACGQFLIYRAMSENRLTAGSENQMNARRVQEIMVAKQLSLVALSDFLCWFPIGLMGLLALSGRDVGTEAYAWSAVLVLPINSALNPVLYTVPLIMKKWEDFKSGSIKQSATRT